MEESEKRPWSGGTSLARAMVIAEARSVPNHGLARAPSTGLRVVATSRVGLPEISAASYRMPAEDSALHPTRGSTAASRAAGASARNTDRRHRPAVTAFTRSPLHLGRMQQRLTPLWLTLDRGESRARPKK